jgi:hypothetical protein
MKDLAMIYHDCDKYRLRVWSPELMREGDLTFTGSNNIEKSIHFNIHFKKDGFIPQKAFNETLKHIIDSGFDMSVDWEYVFTKEMCNLLNN